MADTLEELRKHVEDVIRRLSEAESPAEPEHARPSDATLGELERQINLLGSKIERASNMLAQVTDLLESQTERIETLEQQFEDPADAWPAQTGEEIHTAEPPLAAAPTSGVRRRAEPSPSVAAAAPVAPAPEPVRAEPEPREDRLVEAVNQLLDTVRGEVAVLGTEMRDRIHGLEVRVAEIFGHFAELRDLSWQHRGELRDLEERLLILADSNNQSDARDTPAEAPSWPTPPATAPPHAGVPEAQTYPPAAALSQPSADPAPYAPPADQAWAGKADDEPSPAVGMGAISDEIADAPMDARTARRLEELVEREVRLQQEFAPGAIGPPAGYKGRISVMVVDDLPDARKILSIYLSRTGYHVVTAASAEDCLAKLRHHEVDAVVVDASMPGGGGAQVCRVVRDDPAFAHKRDLPIIVYTAYPEQYPPDVVQQWRATEYVVKGGDMLPLITALVRHTRGGLEARP